MKKACITGHRNLSAKTLNTYRAELSAAIATAVNRGVTEFSMQLNGGTEIMAAELVLELKQRKPNIRLVIYVAYQQMLESPKLKKSVKRILEQCDQTVIAADTFYPNVFLNCVRVMMRDCGELIALYDGRNSGNTAFAMRYCHFLGIPVLPIDASRSPEGNGSAPPMAI